MAAQSVERPHEAEDSQPVPQAIENGRLGIDRRLVAAVVDLSIVALNPRM